MFYILYRQNNNNNKSIMLILFFSKIILFALCHIGSSFYISCMPIAILWKEKKMVTRRKIEGEINDRRCVTRHTTYLNLSIIMYVKKTTCVLGERLSTSLSYHHIAHLFFMSRWLTGKAKGRQQRIINSRQSFFCLFLF
jgi:uncharacterized membrane protein